MMEHTKEPWPYFADCCVPSSSDTEHDGVVRLGFEDYERARVCVDALSGLTNEQIKDGVFTKLQADRDALLIDRDNWREDARALRESQERLWKQRDELRAALEGFLAIVKESHGVTGYHLNGDMAEWDKFPEVDAARVALANAKGGA